MVCAGEARDKAPSTAQWAEITGESQIAGADAAGLPALRPARRPDPGYRVTGRVRICLSESKQIFELGPGASQTVA